jgi:hypothetical protein
VQARARQPRSITRKGYRQTLINAYTKAPSSVCYRPLIEFWRVEDVCLRLCFHSASLLLLAVVSAWAGAGKVEIHQRHMLNPPFVIDQAGSYILTSPLTVTQQNVSAILVQASHVAIDLNGFTITGPGETANAPAIFQDTLYSHLLIKDGTIEHWGGDVAARALSTLGADNRFDDITMVHCRDGLYTGVRGAISGCIVYSNSLSFTEVQGIRAAGGSSVTGSSSIRLSSFTEANGFRLLSPARLADVVAYRIAGSTATFGINAGSHASIRDSMVRRIDSGDGSAVGILAEQDSTVARVTSTTVAAFNVGENATGIQTGDRGDLTYALAQHANDGIRVGNDASVAFSLAISNSLNGVYLLDRSRVSDSLALDNEADGFVLAGQRGEAVDNLAVRNATGFITAAQGTNLVTRNAAIANAIPFSFGAATRSGQLAGNPGAGFTVTNSWANFSISP